MKKRHHYCLKVFNTEKGLHHFLRTLKVSNIEKGLHHFFETLKGFNFWKMKVAYHIIFMINELHLLWVPNFIALGIYFLFGTKFSWKEEIYTCFNVGCVLLGRNFDFLGSYLVVSARYLMIATGYCSLPSGYCSLLVVTARYRSLLLVPTFSMNEKLLLSNNCQLYITIVSW